MKLEILRPHGVWQWIRLYGLYLCAFPKEERKPFFVIVRMYRKEKSDIWYFQQDGRFSGLASTVNSEDLILLDYFAVPRSMRCRGIGSTALGMLQKFYGEKGLFVEIESPYEDTPDRAARKHRKSFYLRNGFSQLNVMAKVFGVNMELLGRNCQMTFESYRSFYRNHYSAFAADHIEKTAYPDFGDRG